MGSLALKPPPPAPAGREAILARHRRYRALTRAHSGRILEHLPKDALLETARRIGLAQGRTVAEEADELLLALDLVIHTAPPGEMRVIDRYAATAAVQPGSDDERVLEAMRDGRFAILGVEGGHDLAGLIVRDVSSLAELWLMDEHLGSNAASGLFATRLFAFDDVHITSGFIVPVDEALLRDVFLEIPFLANRPWSGMVADPRFAEAIYRIAVEDDVFGRLRCPDMEAAGAGRGRLQPIRSTGI